MGSFRECTKCGHIDVHTFNLEPCPKCGADSWYRDYDISELNDGPEEESDEEEVEHKES